MSEFIKNWQRNASNTVTDFKHTPLDPLRAYVMDLLI